MWHGKRAGKERDLNMRDKHYERILEKQLAMNRQTWAALERRGATEDSELRLDFFFYAPNRKAAEQLYALLNEQTDYDVKLHSDGPFLRRKWRIEGTTQKTKISPAILDQWVLWMVTAGKESSCDFDGWGTSF